MGIIEIRATSQYPKEPPEIGLIDSKGLDPQRQKILMNCVRDKAAELASCLMFVALGEEAVDRLSLMNHPDGNCPLCLYSLVGEDGQDNNSPFMKLMSCFHCFHSDCFIRWWNWIQTDRKTNPSGSSSSTTQQHINQKENENGALGVGVSKGHCPVCRKVFYAMDFEHIPGFVASHLSQSGSDKIEVEDNEVLNSVFEITRREKIEAILKLQQENEGLIEPERTVSVSPGMYISLPTTQSTSRTTTRQFDARQERDILLASEDNSGASSHLFNTSDHKKPDMKKPRRRNPRKHVTQWIRKEHTSS